VLDDIEEKCDALANNPLMGRLRAGIAPELRYFAVGNI
jgi:toxin ParE1/3/4